MSVDPRKNEWAAIVLFLIASMLVTGGIWVACSALEASRFERLTGKDVTLVDAMFLQLRVQEPIVERGDGK